MKKGREKGSLLSGTLAALACLGAASIAQAQPVISISGACPGQLVLQWTGAEPERHCALAFAESEGRFVINFGPCSGVSLGLGGSGLRAVTFFGTGANGSGQLQGRGDPSACGGFLQMIVWDGTPCTTSNVVQIPQ